MAAELIVPGLRLPRGAVLSHDSAAAAWRLPLPHHHDGQVHVTLPRSGGRWASTKATVHRYDLPGVDIDVCGGLQVTTPLRTILDLARVWSPADAVSAADWALHAGLLTIDELAMACTSVRGRGARAVRMLLELVDPRSESPLESATRVLLTLSGMRPPASQYSLFDGATFVARLDFAWPTLRVAVQPDGFGYHADRESYRSDREKANALERLRWRLLIFTWEQVHGDPDYVVRSVAELLEQQRML